MIDIQIILMVIQVLLTAVISGYLLLFTALNFLLPIYIIENIDIEDFDSGEGWKATLLIKNVGWGKGQINEFIGASKVLSEGGWSEDSSIRITKNQVPPVHLMPKFLSGNSTEIEVTARDAPRKVEFGVEVSDSRLGRMLLFCGLEYDQIRIEGPIQHCKLWIKSKFTDIEYNITEREVS